LTSDLKERKKIGGAMSKRGRKKENAKNEHVNKYASLSKTSEAKKQGKKGEAKTVTAP
jgi:hypothetical protein